VKAIDFLTQFLIDTNKDKVWEKTGKTYYETYLHDAEYTELVNKNIIPQIVKRAGLNP